MIAAPYEPASLLAEIEANSDLQPLVEFIKQNAKAKGCYLSITLLAKTNKAEKEDMSEDSE